MYLSHCASRTRGMCLTRGIRDPVGAGDGGSDAQTGAGHVVAPEQTERAGTGTLGTTQLVGLGHHCSIIVMLSS